MIKDIGYFGAFGGRFVPETLMPALVELAAAFDALSRADVYLRRTRSLHHYGLWAYAKEMMTSGVAMSISAAPAAVCAW